MITIADVVAAVAPLLQGWGPTTLGAQNIPRVEKPRQLLDLRVHYARLWADTLRTELSCLFDEDVAQPACLVLVEKEPD